MLDRRAVVRTLSLLPFAMATDVRAMRRQATPAVAKPGDDAVPNSTFIMFALAINDLTMRTLIQAVNLARNDEPERIVLLIDSSGGAVESAVDFYNYASSLDRTIDTVNLSRVASAANYVYLTGQRRYAHDASYFMLHPSKSTSSIQGVTQQSFDDLKNSLASSERLLRTILTARAKFPEAEIDAIFKSERHYTADQARRLGLVNSSAKPIIARNDAVIICSESEAHYLKDY